MSLNRVKITDSAISAHAALPGISVLRDTETPQLQVRFSSNRSKAAWRMYYKNRWHKVGEWPLVNTKTIRANFFVLYKQVMEGAETKLSSNCFVKVGDLLDWYGERMSENANLSTQRKKDIKSALDKHLKPRLGETDILDVDKNLLDKKLIWPLQKKLAKSSVVKKFHILKAAFKDAYDLDLLPSHPITGFKISDFGDFREDDKESLLKPRMVPAFLDELAEQPLAVRMVCMLMITLGTRIGETICAKWKCFNLTFDPAWDIPKADTKTKTPITIHLPKQLTELLAQWKAHQAALKQDTKWLFPNAKGDGPIDYESIRKQLHRFSAGEFKSHDMRKCARQCWEEQGVDGLVAERMLNHTLGKTTRAYTGEAYEQRKQALANHADWLEAQNNQCYQLNPVST